MVDRSVPMRVEESNQCESPISIARERSSYSKRFMKLLQDFHHFIQKLDFLGLNTKASIDTPYLLLSVWPPKNNFFLFLGVGGPPYVSPMMCVRGLYTLKEGP